MAEGETPARRDHAALARRAEWLLAIVAATVGVAGGFLAMCVVALVDGGRPSLSLDPIAVAAGIGVAVLLAIWVHRRGRTRRGAIRLRRVERDVEPASPALTERAAALALAFGVRPPTVLVVPDRTINATTTCAPCATPPGRSTSTCG